MLALGGDLLDGGGGLLCLFLQALQFLRGLNDLPLQRVKLLLGNLPVGKGDIGLFGGSLQRFQLGFCFAYGVAQQTLFLGKKLRIAGVQL